MIRVCLLFLSLTTLGVWGKPKEPAEAQCWVVGECLGSNMGVTFTDNKEDCLKACQEATNCEWFTWHSDSKLCNKFSTCPTLDDSCTTCISGENECESDPGSDFQCNVEGECYGDILGTFPNIDGDDCLAECKKNSQCKWYTYYVTQKACLLFGSCDFQAGSCSSQCVSGEQGCGGGVPPVPGQESKIIAITGRDAGKDVELADLPSGYFNQTSITGCSKPMDFPHAMEGAVGAVVNGRVTVCGGRLTGQIYSECYQLDPQAQNWNSVTSPLLARTYAGSVVVPNLGWWVMGGVENLNNNAMTDATEVYDTALDQWNSGPKLPEKLSAFCAVQIDDSRTFIAGGNTVEDAYRYKTYMFDQKQPTWVQKAELIHPREAPACAVYKDNTKLFVIIAGGYNNAGEVSSAEIYDVELNKMAEGPPLPFPLAGARLINDGDNVILVGGQSKAIYQFSGTDWALMPNELKDDNRAYSVILSVSDQSLYGCQSRKNLYYRYP
ncbi:hypothetical protein TCAL_05662 [Tigriopus californicus]|uniref:Apple domain-containing protein n=1 Tax=Tigriopus californicus TaxID=6832 RepID=A0A553PAV6_TIGCA|nr:uncharacterized protein LOC131893497 [Tigriopus californicus]TRY74816.1 hypothetical protein TCAL_05662 [Tigriopus californicus]|eukprot:TCALIF_05662-PA protein Name:"Similar to KLHL41 Kelch-like protein 41 (Homo sapiens)" AED:0.00 eAED:0.00 QI:73/1/1/1/1/1/5/63/494